MKGLQDLQAIRERNFVMKWKNSHKVVQFSPSTLQKQKFSLNIRTHCYRGVHSIRGTGCAEKFYNLQLCRVSRPDGNLAKCHSRGGFNEDVRLVTSWGPFWPELPCNPMMITLKIQKNTTVCSCNLMRQWDTDVYIRTSTGIYRYLYFKEWTEDDFNFICGNRNQTCRHSPPHSLLFSGK